MLIQKLKKYIRVKLLIQNLLIPVLLLLSYCVSYAYLSSLLLFEGVNYDFTHRLSSYLLYISFLIVALIIMLVRFDSQRSMKNYSKQKFSVEDLILLLIPMTPAVNYILNNNEILSIANVTFLLLFFIVFSGFYIILIPHLLSKFSSIRIVKSLGLSFVFTILSMASLSQNLNWYHQGSLKIQLLFFCFILFLSWLLLNDKNKKFTSLIIMFFFILGFKELVQRMR